ncbi:Zinc finger protein-domain-containing protein [Madurella fahalii]|uniref:Zinc finger protein-domain-containing protein n=1 Tax=Madurella fahalii TaxID=1157608 RepID=A0ABQ0G9P5_9PEZI
MSTLQSSRNNPAIYRVNIPLNFAFLAPQSGGWSAILPRLPAGSTACEALISERIMPLPRQVRRRLVQEFWDGGVESVVNDKRNDHCLIRPYLGRRRQSGPRTGRSRFKSISLRNYPLHVDQIEHLGLRAEEYALAMADALAFLHWAARIDANDVEFVLSRPRATAANITQPSIGGKNFTPGVLGPHVMWILDFDCCKALDMNGAGVKVAAERFWRNDPFYPNPDCKCPEDERLWQVFRDRYLEASGSILHDDCEEVRQLPGMLVARIVETVGAYKRGPVL